MTLTRVSKLTVAVQQDHLERLIKSPLVGLAELIWNAVDADSTEVSITTPTNDAGGLEHVVVVDNGLGITPERAERDFGQLGGSWKTTATTTDGGRALHGRLGQGRWSAYGLGERVRWESIAERVAGGRFKITIGGRRNALREFIVSDPVAVDTDAPIGTTVTVEILTPKATQELASPRVFADLTATFALYLFQYPVKIFWQGNALDPALFQGKRTELELSVEGVNDELRLTIIEWTTNVDRAFHLCDQTGVSLGQILPGIHAPGFEFTAYLSWNGFKENYSQVLLGEMAEEPFPVVLDAAKEALRSHFKERTAQRGAELVRAWKDDNTYPYKSEPVGALEKAERDLFEVVAVAAAPAVEDAELKSRALSLRLLREALETSPDTLHDVLQEVLVLPEDRREELRTLLERTTLSAIISSARAITDRLDFLVGLEKVVFERELKKRVKERSQLHRILATETWLFREEYALTADDYTLTTALRAHIGLLGRKDLAPEDVDGSEVLDEHGKRVVVDLMLSRVIEQQAGHREHIVIEIKRPTVHIGLEEFSQIQKYATTVKSDARFAGTDTRWEFWIVGDVIEDSVQMMAKQNNREPGVVVAADNFVVRVVTWATIIREARHRLKFVRKSLDYSSTTAHGMDYLHRTHGRYLPVEDVSAESSESSESGVESAEPPHSVTRIGPPMRARSLSIPPPDAAAREAASGAEDA